MIDRSCASRIQCGLAYARVAVACLRSPNLRAYLGWLWVHTLLAPLWVVAAYTGLMKSVRVVSACIMPALSLSAAISPQGELCNFVMQGRPTPRALRELVGAWQSASSSLGASFARVLEGSSVHRLLLRLGFRDVGRYTYVQTIPLGLLTFSYRTERPRASPFVRRLVRLDCSAGGAVAAS